MCHAAQINSADDSDVVRDEWLFRTGRALNNEIGSLMLSKII